jgi:AbrB family looped-hinge helix DNA binding protein
MSKMVSVTSRGQITIPKPQREFLGLGEVDVIVIIELTDIATGKKSLQIQKATDYLKGDK